MREVDGRMVFDTLSELVDSRHTALLIVDVQNDFCSPGGAFEKNGYDISLYREMIALLQRLLEAARGAGVLPIYVQNTILPGFRSDSAAQVRFRMRLSRRLDEPSIRYTVQGSWGHEIVEEVRPQEDEIRIPKFRSSAFTGTPLDLLLRSNQIQTILVTGATTEGCVESTARDGMFLDYYVVIVSDCVQSDTRRLHEASMTLMKDRFDVEESRDVIETWRARSTDRTDGSTIERGSPR
jgi:nicotinamidase-related amidase